MKAIICLAILSIFAVSSINAAALITENTDRFFIGTWYPTATDPASFKKSKCCVPFGHVEFKDTSSKYSKEITLTATQWAGAACSSTNSKNSLVYTFSPDVSYAKYAGNKYNVYSDDAVQMNVKNFDGTGVHASNNTQKVTFDLRLNYVQREFSGVTCAVTLSRAATPVVPTQESTSSALSFRAKNNDIDTLELVEEILHELQEKIAPKSKFLSYFN